MILPEFTSVYPSLYELTWNLPEFTGVYLNLTEYT